MANILLDYFFKITAVEPTPAASTSFLRQVLVLVKPKAGVTPGTVALVTTPAQLALQTDNVEGLQLFNAGMSRFYVLPLADLTTIPAALASTIGDYFTVLISSDYTDANVTAADFSSFKGVIGVSSVNDTFLGQQASIKNRVAMHATAGNKAKNLFYAIGKVLAGARWRNQQYAEMPFADDVNTLGAAENLFASKISFALSDTQYGNRLGLLAAGGKAIAAPFVIRNLQIDMQSAALAYVSVNQPAYTVKNAALIEDELQKVVDRYAAVGDIDVGGRAIVDLGSDGFTVSADIVVPEPKAIWRIAAEMRQT